MKRLSNWNLLFSGGGGEMLPPSPVSRDQLHKRIESLQQQNRVLKVELETYKLRVKALQEENRALRQASVHIQVDFPLIWNLSSSLGYSRPNVSTLHLFCLCPAQIVPLFIPCFALWWLFVDLNWVRSHKVTKCLELTMKSCWEEQSGF